MATTLEGEGKLVLPIGMFRMVGADRKFVGKVFRWTDRRAEELVGQVVHYREQEWKDVLAHKLDNAYSLDVTAWICAYVNDANFTAVYVTDRQWLLYASADVVTDSPIATLKTSEGAQFRVRKTDITVIKDFGDKCRTPRIADADCTFVEDWREWFAEGVAKHGYRLIF